MRLGCGDVGFSGKFLCCRRAWRRSGRSISTASGRNFADTDVRTRNCTIIRPRLPRRRSMPKSASLSSTLCRCTLAIAPLMHLLTTRPATWSTRLVVQCLERASMYSTESVKFTSEAETIDLRTENFLLTLENLVTDIFKRSSFFGYNTKPCFVLSYL